MPLRIILTTTSTDENWNGDCDYAVVSLEPSELLHLQALAASARQLDTEWAGALKCVELYACDADFYSAASIDDRLSDEVTRQLEQLGIAVLPNAISLDGCEPERTDGGVLGVRVLGEQASIYWGGYPRHAESITIESTELPLAWLEAALGAVPSSPALITNSENRPCPNQNSS